mgnify:CR=1 FL=1
MRTLAPLLVLLFVSTTLSAGPNKAVERALERAVAAAPGSAKLAVAVETPQGEVLYRRQASEALVPASNMKLLTSAAALELLGAGFEHETRLSLLGERSGAVHRGDLWLLGGGDPTISRRFDKDPLLSDWVAGLVKAGVKRIEGDLILEDRVFDAVRLHPAWEPADFEHWYGAEISGLTLNDNCVDVTVAGGAKPRVSCAPESAYLRIQHQAQAVSSRKAHRFGLVRVGEDKRTLRLSGKVWTKAGGYTTSVPVADPAMWFGAVLAARLEAAGVELTGVVRRPRAQERYDYRRGFSVWLRKSPLPRTLAVLNQRSQNLYAECLLKTLGRRDAEGRLTQQGSWPRGAAVIERYAQAQVGIAAGEVKVSDGSGLSRDNRLSARALCAVLRRALSLPSGQVYRESLAQPGEQGTLRRRLRGLPKGVEVRAKTGTLTGVSALSGELRKGERVVVFSLIMNGRGTSRRHLDRILQALAEAL